MSTDAANVTTNGIDYWFHGTNQPHDWVYRGKNAGYRCQTCGLKVSKSELAEATNA